MPKFVELGTSYSTKLIELGVECECECGLEFVAKQALNVEQCVSDWNAGMACLVWNALQG
jgi:hypothetical protein